MEQNAVIGACIEVGALVWWVQAATGRARGGRQFHRVRFSLFGVTTGLAGLSYLTGVASFAIVGAGIMLALLAFHWTVERRRSGG